ncbi:MAG: antibiotic biosynthesis monooxygenase [Terracidiphilus sp.]
MISELKLLHALPSRERFLIDSLRTDGLYAQLARRTVPGFLGVDLLRNSSCQGPTEFLLFTYWSSLNIYSAAQQSTNVIALGHFLSKLAFSASLGTFYTLPDRLIPRFPGASLTQQTEQSSGDTVGLSPDQGNAAGDSEAKGQW